MSAPLPRLLFIDISQFGYHTDGWSYARHLTHWFQVTYLGAHSGKKEFEPGPVQVRYSHGRPDTLPGRIRFLRRCISEIKGGQYHAVFISYTLFCSLLRIRFPRTPMGVDVRTGYVEPGKLTNWIFNTFLRIETGLFRHVSCISKDLARHLGLKKTVRILPVGAEPAPVTIGEKAKNLSLLYVGTFFERNLEVTIEGFHQFLQKFPNDDSATYQIIGFGPDFEIKKLKGKISELGLTNRVHLLGEVRPPDLFSYMASANVGISFVPIVEKFTFQPPTKTYEYMAWGIPVIATRTKFNQEFFKADFGILIPDTPEGFCNALEQIKEKNFPFSSEQILKTASEFYYEKIVRERVVPFLKEIISGE